MKTYSEKLRDPRWQKKRLEILERDKFGCCLCYDIETELHIHHKEYSVEPWEISNDKLQTLCKHCHAVVESMKLKYEILAIQKVELKSGNWYLYSFCTEKATGDRYVEIGKFDKDENEYLFVVLIPEAEFRDVFLMIQTVCGE